MTSWTRIIISITIIATLNAPLARAHSISRPRQMWDNLVAEIQALSPELLNGAVAAGFVVAVTAFLWGQHRARAQALAEVGDTSTPVVIAHGGAVRALQSFGDSLTEQLRRLYEAGVARGRTSVLDALGNQIVFFGENGEQMLWNDLDGTTIPEKAASLVRLYREVKLGILE